MYICKQNYSTNKYLIFTKISSFISTSQQLYNSKAVSGRNLVLRAYNKANLLKLFVVIIMLDLTKR